MASKNNSINDRIFAALAVSELSNVPVLILSNPGCGKTTTVNIFAELRGMRVVELHGNQCLVEEINGYETCPSNIDNDEVPSSVHLRPSWYNRILKNTKDGFRTLLFLDEITTANEYVQSALLKVIFDRCCGPEPLPEDTLIVAAGNYFTNLSNTMVLLPPTMNRFMLFNITPSKDDIPSFLNKYSGAIINDGKTTDRKKELREHLKQIDSQRLNLSEEKKNKIGEYLERACNDSFNFVVNDKGVDIAVTDLKDIYSDFDDSDPKLYGFITPRTLGYLTEVAVACYTVFGSAGIKSDNFLEMINGLVGIGLRTVKNNNNSVDTKKIPTSSIFFQGFKDTLKEIEKMDNNKLPEYEKYFNELVKTASKRKTGFTEPEMNGLFNKIKDMISDPDIANVEKPIEESILKSIYSNVYNSSLKLCDGMQVNFEDDVFKVIPIEAYTKDVITWNLIADVNNVLNGIVGKKVNNYSNDVAEFANKTINGYRGVVYKIKSIRKLLFTQAEKNPSKGVLVKGIPDIKSINSITK